MICLQTRTIEWRKLNDIKNVHSVLRHGIVDPSLHFEGQETENKIHGAAHEFVRLSTQPRGACSLSPEIVVQSHVVGEREPRLVDLQKVSNKLFFARNLARNLLQSLAKDLIRVRGQ